MYLRHPCHCKHYYRVYLEPLRQELRPIQVDGAGVKRPITLRRSVVSVQDMTFAAGPGVKMVCIDNWLLHERKSTHAVS